MVKISGTPIVEGYTNTGARRVRVSLWADSEDEISGVVTGEEIEGLNTNDVLTMGSTCLTVTEGSFGRLGSNGVWTF